MKDSPLPGSLARHWCERLPLRSHPLPIELPTSGVYAVWHERTHNAEAHRWLREQLLETFSVS